MLKTHAEDLAKRVQLLCSLLWGDSQTAMARDLKISPSLVSKTLAGTRKPGAKVLSALAAHREISPVWLMTGEGEPLAERDLMSRGSVPFVPVSTKLLPGPPRQHFPLIRNYVPIEPELYGADRYWYEIESSSIQNIGVDVGDRLLIDADKSWLANPGLLLGQPCAAPGAGASSELALRRLRFMPVQGANCAFDVDVSQGDQSAQVMLADIVGVAIVVQKTFRPPSPIQEAGQELSSSRRFRRRIVS